MTPATAQPIAPAPAGPHIAALAGWLALQLAALLLAGLQVPLSDNFPRPAESMALDEMLVVQVGFAALLFPILLPNLPTAVIAIVATWPLVQLAGALAAVEPLRVFLSGAYVCGWLALLALWRSILPCHKSRMFGVAVAALLSIGAAVLWYLRAEFVTEQINPDWARDGLAGPILGVLAILHQEQNSLRPWLPLGIAAAVTAAFRGLLRSRFASARPGSSTSTCS
jgi:hypothetical protein